MHNFLIARHYHPSTLGYLLTLVVATSLMACAQKTTSHQHHFTAFGTAAQLVIYNHTRQQAEQAFAMAEHDFNYMAMTWNPRQKSALGRMNTLLQTGEWFSIAPSIKPLLDHAIPLARASQHLFNPATGEFNQLWAALGENRPAQGAPSEAAIQRVLAYQLRLTDIEQDGIRVRSRNPNIFLDFEAFAIGHGVNMVVKRLQEMGITTATLRVGGNLYVLGEPSTYPWRTQLHLPTQVKEQSTTLSLVVGKNESVFSCPQQPQDGRSNDSRLHPIIDPRTGYPATTSRSVTVIHPNAATADAAATALFIAGPEHWHAIAKRLGIKFALLVDNEGAIHANPAMIKRLQWEPSAQPEIQVSAPL